MARAQGITQWLPLPYGPFRAHSRLITGIDMLLAGRTQ
jgi:hypothetical protein